MNVKLLKNPLVRAFLLTFAVLIALDAAQYVTRTLGAIIVLGSVFVALLLRRIAKKDAKPTPEPAPAQA